MTSTQTKASSDEAIEQTLNGVDSRPVANERPSNSLSKSNPAKRGRSTAKRPNQNPAKDPPTIDVAATVTPIAPTEAQTNKLLVNASTTDKPINPPKESEKVRVLTPAEKSELAEAELIIETTLKHQGEDLIHRALALAKIRKKKLYLGTHNSFEKYCNERWKYRRAHANRLALIGEIIERVSPLGDFVKLLNSESHYRPILHNLKPELQMAIIQLVGNWAEMAGQNEIRPAMVESAKLYLLPPNGPAERKNDMTNLVIRCVTVVEGMEKKLPPNAPKEVKQVFHNLKKKVKALDNPRRSTGIDWATITWNPLQGCSRASAGCNHCYAAKLIATRMAHVYPGLAKEVTGKDDKKTYIFNNIIKLLPEQLGEPLKDRVPKRYFVNSMSDLFHDKVPKEFIVAVFKVMESAHWHIFQVLSKRPKRMAEFIAEHWKDKTPPQNVWLGTSTENQDAFDERYPELLKVNAAVRWLSVEPLIGPITFGSMEGIDWVVVGGESGSMRRMEKSWVVGIRDACTAANVPFFFKQWGEYGEDGKKLKKSKKDGLTPTATLDGEIHDAYPQAPEDPGDATAEQSKSAAPALQPSDER